MLLMNAPSNDVYFACLKLCSKVHSTTCTKKTCGNRAPLGDDRMRRHQRADVARDGQLTGDRHFAKVLRLLMLGKKEVKRDQSMT